MALIAMGILLLTALQGAAKASLDCPLNFTVQQKTLIPRPRGVATLICNISGVSNEEVLLYWWLISERNLPIFIKDRTKPEILPPEYNFLKPKETHTYSRNSVVTHLKLHVNISDFSGYKCEFELTKNRICEKVYRVRFEDPDVKVNHEIDVDSNKDYEDPIINVTCETKYAVGKPHFDLLYNGTESHRFKILHQENQIHNIGDYYFGDFTARVKLPRKGLVVCQVKDARGVYNDSIRIDITDGVYSAKTSNFKVVQVVVVPLLFLIAVILGPLALWKCKSKPTCKLQDGFPLHQDIVCGFVHKDIGKVKMAHIKELSQTAVLFGENGPQTEDVRQDVGAEVDSWFLASLYSLCLTKSAGYLERIFEGVKNDLSDQIITLKLWHFGEWKTTQITPYLPAKNGKLCFTHARRRRIFWSALLQKAYFMESAPDPEFKGEKDIHCLEDFTGGVVLSKDNIDWSRLKTWHKNGYPMTCVHHDEDRFSYFSIIAVQENGNDKCIKLREFKDMDAEVPRLRSKSADEEMPLKTPENAISLSYSDFTGRMRRVSALLTDLILISNQPGYWEQTNSSDDFQTDEFWKNPQYLICCDTKEVPKAESKWVYVALMQKLQRPESSDEKENNTPVAPLQIGLMWFKITDSNFHPVHALTRVEPAVRDRSKTPPAMTRELGYWVKAPAENKHILIPYVMGACSHAEFLLRVFTYPKFSNSITSVKLLPPCAKPVVRASECTQKIPRVRYCSLNSGHWEE